ncbi:MAG TPA: dihydrodipicolinate synthase family protein [Planctomycetota bacterium]|nr:dihydrodipicolinate synthase family protein [Planctomycetota bacterium]
MTQFIGLIAAPFTPFTSSGDLNLAAVPELLNGLVRDGVSGAFVAGTTGEGLSLTSDEREKLTEAWIAARKSHPQFRIIVHVGHVSAREASRLAACAEKCGADAIAALPPFYYKPASIDVALAALAQVAGAAPALPFFYYHIPSMTGVSFKMLDLLRAAASKIPNFAGMKFTHEDLSELQACLQLDGGRFQILAGRDEMLLATLAMGAKCAIGSTYNFNGPAYLRMIDAFARKDHETARRLQYEINQFARLAQSFGGLRASKFIMWKLRADCGPVRPPLAPLSNDEMQRIEKELATLKIS